MRTTCWNCQGVGNTLTVRHLRDIYGQYIPEVVFLSETKNKRDYLENVCGHLGYHDLWTVEPEGIGGGLALLWKEEVQVKILSSSSRWIDTHIVWKDKTFFLTGVYGDPISSERSKVWEQLIRIREGRNDPWILLGDFNEILCNEEKRGGVIRSESSFFPFRNLMTACGLMEVSYQGNPFSWFGYRGDGLVHCKLDRVVANADWHLLFPEARSLYLPRIGSDHSPIVTSFNGDEPRRIGTFRYDKRWKAKEGFNEVVHHGWNQLEEEEEADLVAKIRSCRRAMAKWKRHSKPNSEFQIRELKRKIDEITHQDAYNRQELQALKSQLHKAYKDEEAFWRQKS